MSEDVVRGAICYEYRDTLKTGARTEYLLLRWTGEDFERIRPRWTERSRTGAHGEDCYLPDEAESADVIVRAYISNSGRHHCKIVKAKEGVDKTKLLLWLERNDHVCVSLFNAIANLE